MNIAIVEDESLTALFIQETLEELGHTVVFVTPNAQDLLDKVKELTLDVVLMDIAVEGTIDGIQCATMLYQQYDISSIFLTSYKDENTMEDAMDAKPLGYLVKPVDEYDIAAAIKVAQKILTNTTKQPKDYLEVGPYSFDTKTKVLKYDGIFVKLTKNESMAIELLFQNNGTMVSQEQLLYHIWAENDTSKLASVRELIYRLRKKLPHLSIDTISKMGYTVHQLS